MKNINNINFDKNEEMENFIRILIYYLGYFIKNKLDKNAKLIFYNIKKNIFFYDFLSKKKITIENLNNLEKYINDILIKKNNLIEKKVNFKELKKIFLKFKNKYKLYYIKKIYKLKKVNKYYLYYFNRHIEYYIKKINYENFKKLYDFNIEKKIYQKWYSDKINKMSYRIYINLNYKKIDNNLNIKLYDHRLINKYNNIYHIDKECLGMIFWNNNGTIIYNELINYIRKILIINNYIEVKTPIILKKKLWEKTKHINFYKNNIFKTKIGNNIYYIKPMNCPGHSIIFKRNIKSYKDLPYRILEFGNCNRYEKTGSLHGLLRTRSFHQDDTHIFCDIKQIYDEMLNSIKIMYEIYNIFNFKNILVSVSTRPNNKIGNNIVWDKSEKIIFDILNKNNILFNIKEGEGAFYGPKIEFLLLDFSNKYWQCGTIQIDFFISKNLNVYYLNKNNKIEYPIVIHKAIFGSIERFTGIIIEHYKNLLPTWLCPIQVVIINVNIKQYKYINKINKELLLNNIRSIKDISNNTINYKIKKYINKKVPYIIICGDNELKKNKISVKTLNIDKENLNMITIKKFIKYINNIIFNKK